MKLDDNAVSPAIDQIADLDVYSSSDIDSSLFDDIDFNEPRDIDELDHKRVIKEEPKPVTLKSITTTNGKFPARPLKAEEDTKPGWLSLYDPSNVESKILLDPSAPRIHL
jgi:DNA polymerase alpha subunit A